MSLTSSVQGLENVGLGIGGPTKGEAIPDDENNNITNNRVVLCGTPLSSGLYTSTGEASCPVENIKSSCVDGWNVGPTTHVVDLVCVSTNTGGSARNGESNCRFQGEQEVPLDSQNTPKDNPLARLGDERLFSCKSWELFNKSFDSLSTAQQQAVKDEIYQWRKPQTESKA